MVSQDVCNTDLSLSGFINHKPDQTQQNRKHSLLSLKYDHVFPSLSLGLLSSEEKGQNLYREASSLSGVSSYSNSSVKRDREINGEEFEVERESPRVQMNDIDQDEEASVRKKLRLTKQQSIILEDSFKEHTTLNPKQKVDLAKELNLRPRQVEVWFQNRRARTKLKQTEVEYELLKKCCETLTDENKRLEKELQELKAMNKTAPFYLQLPTATLTMCPSCQRIGGSNEISGKSRFSNIGPTPPFYNPFTHPSAAC